MSDPTEGIDLSRPNAARVYDYYLGGTTTSPPTGGWPRTRSSCGRTCR
ncbi:hypothetical protein [Saccharopolyspora sp. CA-218241]